jgi:hypothetical protein
MRKSVLNVEVFRSQYAYNPPEAKSAWHLIFDNPEGDNETQTDSYSDDDELFVDYETKQSLTFGHVRSLSMRLAHGFLNNIRGVQTGDVVAVFALNSIRYPACVYSIWAAGLGTSITMRKLPMLMPEIQSAL